MFVHQLISRCLVWDVLTICTLDSGTLEREVDSASSEESDANLEEKKPRSANFLADDVTVLVDVYENFYSILDSPFSAKCTHKTKKEAWKNLLSNFNEKAKEKRTLPQLKNKLHHLWKVVNRYKTAKRRHTTGRGSPPMEWNCSLRKLASFRAGSSRLKGLGAGVESGSMSLAGTQSMQSASNDTVADSQESTKKRALMNKQPIRHSTVLSILEEQQMIVLKKQEKYLDMKIKALENDEKIRSERMAFEQKKQQFEENKMDFKRQKMNFELQKVRSESNYVMSGDHTSALTRL